MLKQSSEASPTPSSAMAVSCLPESLTLKWRWKYATSKLITDSNVENNIGTLRFTENIAGSDAEAELKLPRGFYWDTDVTEVVTESRYGMTFPGTMTIDVDYKDRADVPGTRYRTAVLDFSDYVNEGRTSSWTMASSTTWS